MMINPLVFAVLLPGLADNGPEVTVYNQGFGLVKELRSLKLRAGRQSVSVEDVAAMIETNSVAIRPLSKPDAFSVLEQNYQYDLISVQAILNKAVGQEVRFNRVLPNGEREVVAGTLLSSPTAIVGNANGGQSQTYNGMVIRTKDGRILLNPSGEIEVTSLPEGLISKPTLMWEVDAAAAGDVPIELSYLTQGISWKADYVLQLDGMSAADLQGWVTMTNNSGATYENAKLKLLAGDVERARPEVMADAMKSMGRAGGAGGGGFQEETLFEYHLYTLQRPATIRNKEIKQLSLLESRGLKYTKKLIVDSMAPYRGWYPQEGAVGVGDVKPLVKIEFVNSEANKLGMPLPKGTVKVYQRDKSGSVQMLGEDNIDHTPKDERISLTVGRSFDVRSTRTRTNFKRISSNQTEETFSIEVRNRKETPETVYVLERHWSDWKVSGESMKFTKLDANTMEFKVDLKAGETKTITYTVNTKW